MDPGATGGQAATQSSGTGGLGGSAFAGAGNDGEGGAALEAATGGESFGGENGGGSSGTRPSNGGTSNAGSAGAGAGESPGDAGMGGAGANADGGDGGSFGNAGGEPGTGGSTGVGGAGGTVSTGGTGGVAPGCSLSGTTYATCSAGATHDDATATCESMGMRLIRVDSQAENDWLATAVTNSWIGATDLAVEGEWRWDDGTLFWLGDDTGSAQNGLYNAWNILSPAASPPASDCARMNSTRREWIAVLCPTVVPFVCEAY